MTDDDLAYDRDDPKHPDWADAQVDRADLDRKRAKEEACIADVDEWFRSRQPVTHTAHPDVHEHGLQDGCPRCAQQADAPIAWLDPEMIENLCQRVRDGLPARSTLEAVAMEQIRKAARDLLMLLPAWVVEDLS